LHLEDVSSRPLLQELQLMPQLLLLLAQLLGGRTTETLMSGQVDDSIGTRMNSM
jgi:hypothetical protein